MKLVANKIIQRHPSIWIFISSPSLQLMSKSFGPPYNRGWGGGRWHYANHALDLDPVFPYNVYPFLDFLGIYWIKETLQGVLTIYLLTYEFTFGFYQLGNILFKRVGSTTFITFSWNKGFLGHILKGKETKLYFSF